MQHSCVCDKRTDQYYSRPQLPPVMGEVLSTKKYQVRTLVDDKRAQKVSNLSVRSPFIGHGMLSVSTKGGLRLPANIAKALVSCRARISVRLHDSETCLVIGTLDRQYEVGEDGYNADTRLNDNDDLPGQSSQARRVFGFCDEVMRPFEDVRLSVWAQAIAGISTTVLFVGTGDTVELWSPENAMSSGDENLVALAGSAKALACSPSNRG